MYKIGDFVFDLRGSSIPVPVNLNKFKVENVESNYIYTVCIVDDIEIYEDTFITNRENIKVIKNGVYEKRYLNFFGNQNVYASTEEINDNETVVKINKSYLHYFDIDTMFASILSLEKHLCRYHQFILHSSYIVYQNHAILFTAASGVGKSTQASLWEKYCNTFTVNGDRSLLMKKEDNYYVGGLPICGSSEICFNITKPLGAIVILKQGEKNEIRKATYSEGIKHFLKEITINYNNQVFFDSALSFIEDLVKNINIYILTCDISEDAVMCLKNKLQEEDYE